jgi:hypothetical protein
MIDIHNEGVGIGGADKEISGDEVGGKHYGAEEVTVSQEDEDAAAERIRSLQALINLPDMVAKFESLGMRVETIRQLDANLIETRVGYERSTYEEAKDRLEEQRNEYTNRKRSFYSSRSDDDVFGEPDPLRAFYDNQRASRPEKYVADIQLATQAFMEFQAEYFIRHLSEGKLNAMTDYLIGHMEIPAEFQISMGRFAQYLNENRLDFATAKDLSVFDDQTRARMVAEPSVDIDVTAKTILSTVINEADMLEISDYALSMMSKVLLSEVLSDNPQQAESLRESDKGEYFHLDKANHDVLPARGLKLHLAADWKELGFLKVLLAMRQAGKENFAWKIRIYSSGLNDKKNQTLITVYPQIDEPSAYNPTDSITNFNNTMSIACALEKNLLNLGIGPCPSVVFDSDLNIGESGRIGLRYGELRPPGGKEYVFDYQDGWVDNRHRPMSGNLPSSVSIDSIGEVAAKNGVKIHY